MYVKNKIRSYEGFKLAWGKTQYYKQMVELRQSSPELYESYKERLKKEKLKKSNPMEYLLKYGGNPKVEL